MLDDVLPSLTDGNQLYERAVKYYVMEFLLDNFSSLKDLKMVMHKVSSSFAREKSSVLPMAM